MVTKRSEIRVPEILSTLDKPQRYAVLVKVGSDWQLRGDSAATAQTDDRKLAGYWGRNSGAHYEIWQRTADSWQSIELSEEMFSL
jgi:ferric-dicitrate binding protein FerR (iron transport regulator)